MIDQVMRCEAVRGGYRITLSQQEPFFLPNADYRAQPLQPGDALDWEVFRRQLFAAQAPRALHRAVALLSARARSRREVEQKLSEAGYQPEAVAAAVNRLIREHLLDDAAFANAWAASRAARGLGRARILQELRLKGISSETAEAALASLEADDQAAQAVRIAAKYIRRYRTLPPSESRQKGIAALARRGFSYGEASRAWQRALEEAPEDAPGDDDPS